MYLSFTPAICEVSKIFKSPLFCGVEFIYNFLRALSSVRGKFDFCWYVFVYNVRILFNSSYCLRSIYVCSTELYLVATPKSPLEIETRSEQSSSSFLDPAIAVADIDTFFVAEGQTLNII